jgi:hypothetical protein
MEIKEVKAKMHDIVFYELDAKTVEYKLNACILRMNKEKNYFYQAELLDLKSGNSVLIVPLEKVKTKNS